MLKNLLIYRFAIFNLMAIALGVVAYERGLVQHVVENDTTGIVYAIAALFLVGWVAIARRIVVVSRMLNVLKSPYQQSLKRAASKISAAKFRAKVAWMNDVSAWLVGLGLIGTVIGFSIALSGIDPDSLAQASGVQVSVGKLMEGMRIALNTTIAGAVLGMWNEVNCRMMKTALECLLADLEKAG